MNYKGSRYYICWTFRMILIVLYTNTIPLPISHLQSNGVCLIVLISK